MFCLRCLAVASVALFAVGCGGQRNAPPSDPTAARRALETTLDAWQNGATLESLRSDERAIIVNDHDWQAGARLVRYEIQGDGTKFGNRLVFNTTLELRASGGKSQRTSASYVVATEPTITVRRSDLNE